MIHMSRVSIYKTYPKSIIYTLQMYTKVIKVYLDVFWNFHNIPWDNITYPTEVSIKPCAQLYKSSVIFHSLGTSVIIWVV